MKKLASFARCIKSSLFGAEKTAVGPVVLKHLGVKVVLPEPLGPAMMINLGRNRFSRFGSMFSAGSKFGFEICLNYA